MVYRILLSLLLLGSIISIVHSQTANMRHVATVDLKNQSAVGVDWMVTDSTRYWYDAQGNYSKRETYCYDSSNYSYFHCRTIDNYYSGDTSMFTIYEYNSSLLALKQVQCYFNRTDSMGRTLESGGCFNPAGSNWGYSRTYYTYDSLGRTKQYRYAAWNQVFQRLTNSIITDYFYDTLGYERYQYTQVNNGSSFYLGYIAWDSIDPSTNTKYFTEISKASQTAAWDTSRQTVTYSDTVGAIVTLLNINRGINMDGVFGNGVKDSTITDTINFTIEQHRFAWNDTVQVWQQITRHFMERDSTGRTLYSESAIAPYTGAAMVLTHEAAYAYDSLSRAVFRLSHEYDYNSGALRYVNEVNTEYDVPVGDSTGHITINISQNVTDSLTVISKDDVYFDSLTRRVEYRYATFDTIAQEWHPRYWGYYYYDENQLIGMENIASNSLNLVLSPNPTSGAASIHFVAKGAMLGTLTVHDVSGRQVLAQNIQISAGDNGDNEVAINLKSLGISAAGLYIVTLTTPDARYTGKLLYQP